MRSQVSILIKITKITAFYQRNRGRIGICTHNYTLIFANAQRYFYQLVDTAAAVEEEKMQTSKAGYCQN